MCHRLNLIACLRINPHSPCWTKLLIFGYKFCLLTVKTTWGCVFSSPFYSTLSTLEICSLPQHALLGLILWFHKALLIPRNVLCSDAAYFDIHTTLLIFCAGSLKFLFSCFLFHTSCGYLSIPFRTFSLGHVYVCKNLVLQIFISLFLSVVVYIST